MKKVLTILSILVLCAPFGVSAAINAPFNATSTDIGGIGPNRINGNDPYITASSYNATSSTATSTLLNTSVNQFKIAALSGILKAVSGYITTATAGTDYLTGNQTITLSGDISGSGSTAITTAIGALKVLNSMIANGTIDLTAKVTGTLPFANGGTATSTLGIQGQNWIVNSAGAFIATSSLFTTTAGNIGIGTTNPTEVNANARVTVAGIGSQDYIASTTDNTTSSDAIYNAYAPGSRVFLGAHGTNQSTTQYGITVGGYGELGSLNSSLGTSNGLLIGTRTTNTPIVLGTNSLERVRVTGGGSVGVSTSTPFAKLSVHANNGETNTNLFNIGSSTATATTTLFNVINTGNVGIGTTTPYANLGINAPAGSLATSPYFSIGSSTAELVKVYGSAATKVGIASSSPNYTLSVEGTVGLHGLTTSAGLQSSILCGKEVSGGEVIAESVACVASAKRYKENIEDLDVGLEELMALRPVSFTWKKEFNAGYEKDPNKNGVQYSLVADEVKQVDPKLVNLTTSTTTFEGKTYAPGTINGLADVNHWVSVFVKWLQEIVNRQNAQQREIDDLRAEFKTYKAHHP